jgi:hypothetical protein
MNSAHVTGMCEQKLTAGQRQLTSFGPSIILSDPQLDANVAYLVAIYGVWKTERLSACFGLILNEGAKLSHQFEKPNHRIVKLSMHERQT